MFRQLRLLSWVCGNQGFEYAERIFCGSSLLLLFDVYGLLFVFDIFLQLIIFFLTIHFLKLILNPFNTTFQLNQILHHLLNKPKLFLHKPLLIHILSLRQLILHYNLILTFHKLITFLLSFSRQLIRQQILLSI
jgi:hypothetical protein